LLQLGLFLSLAIGAVAYYLVNKQKERAAFLAAHPELAAKLAKKSKTLKDKGNKFASE
jgi:2-oxo-4-hydroxy-4-carboxy--5-ureidoimidazoline (OHCU) decarboxylase